MNTKLITLAESVQEAMSDFTDYAQENGLTLDEGSLRELKDSNVDSYVVNIIDFNFELPEDNDGWFIINSEPNMSYDEWCAGIERVSVEDYQAGIRAV